MKKLVHPLVWLVFATGCIQKFQPNLISPSTGYLVVDGIINSGGGPATVHLSRTTQLTDSSILNETGATVQVKGSDNSLYTLSEKGHGLYGTDQLALNAAMQYRLYIRTSAGTEYLSDFSGVKITPAIDIVHWQQENGGVQIYANTHDPANSTHYYKWDYAETWEFHSPFIKELAYDTVIDANGKPQLGVQSLNDADISIFTCWQSDYSTQILLASSAKLSSDVITAFPIANVPPSSIKLSVLYSIELHQFALTTDQYNYLAIMQKNTEETGSIFGSQPSQLRGNIHCVSNPSETVIGYVGFASMESKRIFINSLQLSGWDYHNFDCMQDSILTRVEGSPDPYEQINAAFGRGLIPTTALHVNFATGEVTRFLAAPPFCVDCTLSGTNIKPSYWP